MKNKNVPFKSLVFFAIGLIFCGILLLIYPVASFLTVYFIFGIMAIVRGIMLLLTLFNNAKTTKKGCFSTLILAIFLLIAGLSLLFVPAFITSIFAYLLAIWFILDGISGILNIKALKIQGKFIYFLSIILCLIMVLGGISLLFNPYIISVAIPVIIGINVLALGINSLIIAFTLRKIQ